MRVLLLPEARAMNCGTDTNERAIHADWAVDDAARRFAEEWLIDDGVEMGDGSHRYVHSVRGLLRSRSLRAAADANG